MQPTRRFWRKRAKYTFPREDQSLEEKQKGVAPRNGEGRHHRETVVLF